MSKENVHSFGEAIKNNPALQDELSSLAMDYDGVVELGKREGFEFSLDDLHAVLKELNASRNVQLTDDELESVAGGLMLW